MASRHACIDLNSMPPQIPQPLQDVYWVTLCVLRSLMCIGKLYVYWDAHSRSIHMQWVYHKAVYILT